MYNLNSNIENKKQSFGFAIILLVVSVLSLFFGILGIVEHKSPHNLESLSTLGISFITYLEYHAMILLGTLGITLSVWLSQHSQNR
ncbi:MAG: hypothetical protein QNL62_25880 [Gammaproteobacteria bacterium]|nr:hypothetical protein [Gammaproteobacteria bacterium]